MDAGADRTVAAGARVTLTATASDVDGEVVSWAWSQLSGTDVAMVSPSKASTVFEAPISVDVESLVFQVTVRDNKGASKAARVTITVAAGVSAPEHFRVRAVGTNAALNWDDVADAGTYNLYMATESFSSLSSLANYATLANGELFTNISSASSKAYQLTNLESGLRYYFVVTAVCSASVCGAAAESQPSDEVTRLIGQSFPSTRTVQDTTVSECITADNLWGDCSDTMPGQDAEYGRTAAAVAGSLSKNGSGVGPFDFTWLDEDGTAVAAGSSAAHCVLDNLSGLTWELKLAGDLTRDSEYRFSWYDADETVNGGDAGLFYGPECPGGLCNTWSYADALGKSKVCGLSAWRLPTVAELRGISDAASLCDADGADCPFDTHSWYWSATSVAADPSQAWMVTLDGRADTAYSKELPRQVLMVSDGGVN